MCTLLSLKNRKLTIFSRLMLGNLAILIMASAISSYAILQLGQMRQLSSRIIQVHNVLIDLNKEMSAALLTKTRYEKKFLLVHDQSLYEGFLSSCSDFKNYLDRALALADSSKTRQALLRIQTLNQRYDALFQEEVDSLKSGKPIPRKSHGRKKERILNAAMEELTRLRSLSQQSILQKVNELDETGTRARTVAIIITAIALLLGILLSITITRSITLPLSRMKNKTEEIAGGYSGLI